MIFVSSGNGKKCVIVERPLRNNNNKTHFTRNWSRVSPDVVLGHGSACWQGLFLPLPPFIVPWIRPGTVVSLSPEKVELHLFGMKKEVGIRDKQLSSRQYD